MQQHQASFLFHGLAFDAGRKKKKRTAPPLE
jgi:hypothetical protein